MVSLLLYGFLAVVVVVVLFVLAVYVLPKGEQIAAPAPDIRPWALAEQPLVAQDIVQVRLPVALRGYRFAETDLLLDRLTEELRLRDAEIAELRAQLPAGVEAAGESEASRESHAPQSDAADSDAAQSNAAAGESAILDAPTAVYGDLQDDRVPRHGE